MITVLIVIVLVAAVYAGLTYHLHSRLGFVVGVAVTLGCWGGPSVLPPSYANALYFVLGLLGSVFFGLTGAVAWCRSRHTEAGFDWFWLIGGALVMVPVVVLGGYQLLGR
jgi:hypothetical protein